MLEHFKMLVFILAILLALLFSQTVRSQELGLYIENVSMVDSRQNKEKMDVIVELSDGSQQVVQVNKRELKDEVLLVKKIRRLLK